MAERRNGAGSRLAGVLERSTPPSAADIEDIDGPAAEEGPAEAAPAPRGAGGRKGKAPAAESRAARKVGGHTVYLPDDLWERLLVQSHRRRKTISEYVAAILDRQVPDHRAAARPARIDPAEPEATETA